MFRVSGIVAGYCLNSTFFHKPFDLHLVVYFQKCQYVPDMSSNVSQDLDL